MRKGLLLVAFLCTVATAAAQQPFAARANVTAYYDESDIEKNAYRESPYYMELTGSWKQQRTDSSIVYTRQLDVEKTWKDYRVFLNVRCGRGVRVSLNGHCVGRGDDSRHWNEFLLDGFLKYGTTNTLSIEALRHPQGALLEDSALRVGLNGEPYILFKNDPGVSDLSLVADYDHATATGTLTVAANVFCGKKKGKYYLEVVLWDAEGHEFDRMGRWVVFNGRNEETIDISRSWPNVEPWSAETPVLYTAVVRLRNEKMEEEELVGGRFGFRRVEVKDGLLQVNDRPVTLRGVTYGIEHTEGFASREQMRRDVIEMKKYNINAVRTSRFSPMDPYFYELCDRYGLYVVCDANLLPLSEQRLAVATDQDYIPLFHQRVEHLYGKYKNHTSIIAWSLGNSRDNGVCMNAAYRRLKALDKTRPVIFSGADYSDATDIIAPIHPNLQTLKQSLAKQGTRPYLMLASVDASHFADLEALWQLVAERRQLQGGFVDAWPMSQPMLAELKQLYNTFEVSLSKLTPDEGEFVVTNRNDFSNFSRYTLDYNIYTNLRSNITGGDLPVAVSAGGSDKVTMRIPQLDLQPGEEMFIRFNLRRRNADPLFGGSCEVGTQVFPLTMRNANTRTFTNTAAPVPDSLNEQLLSGCELFFLGHENWTISRVDRLTRRPDAHTLCVDDMLSYTAPDGNVMCDVHRTCTLFGTGDVVVDYTLAPAEHVADGLLQPVLRVQHRADSIIWFGIDREVWFRGRNSGLPGIYSQTAGRLVRQQVRWCALQQGGAGLFLQILGTTCTVSADNTQIQLLPPESNSFRLRLRHYEDDNPASLAGTEFPRMAIGILEPPLITASEARFSQPLTVTLSAPAAQQIRYTLDGSDPTEDSPLYSAPFTISTTTVVRARAYAKDMAPSFIAMRRFTYDHIVKTTFSRRPNTPYNVGADTVLFDGRQGDIDDLSRGWLGFSGPAVTTTVDLASSIDVEFVTLRYAHSPASWVFSPQQITVELTLDSVAGIDTVSYTVPFDPADQAEATPRVVEMRIPVHRQSVRSLRIVPRTLDALPDWHRGKGLKPWLMMDEIEIIDK